MKNIVLAVFIIKSVLLSSPANKPKMFIECSFCDFDYIKTEIVIVDHVKDRADSDISVLILHQTTGSGGGEYTLEFTGRNQFDKLNDRTFFFTNPDDSAEVIRNKIVRYINLGLVTFLSKTLLSDKIEVAFCTDDEILSDIQDKWDSWVFSIGSNGFFEGEKSYNTNTISGRISANRITEAWKLNSSYSVSYSMNNYMYEDVNIHVVNQAQNGNIFIAKSISNHWSAGFDLNGGSSTFSNKEFNFSTKPVVEYNLFPYSESNMKEFRISYGLCYNYIDYVKTTIYNKEKEEYLKHELSVSLSIKRVWGSVITSVTGSVFAVKSDFKRLDSFIFTSLNIFKGFNFFAYSGYSMIHDQIYLEKGDITQEDLILKRRAMETSYSYWSSVGFSYTFGSIYNNVVNPRFGN